MNRTHNRLLGSVSLIVSWAALGIAWAQTAHVHGVGQLNVALDGKVVEMELIAPGADIVGFEHEPKSEAQWKAVEAAVATLESGATLFAFPANAGCRLQSAEVENAPLEGDDHGEEHEAEDDHAEFHVHYRFTCTRPDRLSHIDLRYFQAFPAARELDAQTITSDGQGAQELTPGAARLKF